MANDKSDSDNMVIRTGRFISDFSSVLSSERGFGPDNQ
jgi:hypothetical protein